MAPWNATLAALAAATPTSTPSTPPISGSRIGGAKVFIAVASIMIMGLLMACCYNSGRRVVLLRLHNAPAHEVHNLIEDMCAKSLEGQRRYKSVKFSDDDEREQRTITIVLRWSEMGGGEGVALRTAARRRAATERIFEGQRDRPVLRNMEEEMRREEGLVGGENIVRPGEVCIEMPPPYAPPPAYLRREDPPGQNSRRPSAV